MGYNIFSQVSPGKCIIVNELILRRVGQRTAYGLDQLLPATSAVQTTFFFPGAALHMAAACPSISTAGAGTPQGQYALPTVPVLRPHSWLRGGQQWSEGAV